MVPGDREAVGGGGRGGIVREQTELGPLTGGAHGYQMPWALLILTLSITFLSLGSPGLQRPPWERNGSVVKVRLSVVSILRGGSQLLEAGKGAPLHSDPLQDPGGRGLLCSEAPLTLATDAGSDGFNTVRCELSSVSWSVAAGTAELVCLPPRAPFSQFSAPA